MGYQEMFLKVLIGLKYLPNMAHGVYGLFTAFTID